MRTAVSLLLLVASGCAPRLDTRLDDFLAETMEAHRVPGLAVACHPRTGDPLAPRSRHAKPRRAESLVCSTRLPYRRRSSRPRSSSSRAGDARVTAYLPYFELADERYRDITIRQMLNHTSGMPDVEDHEWDRPQLDEGAAERFVRSLSGAKMIGALSRREFDGLDSEPERRP